MITPETIAELKTTHADAWQQKRTAGLTEQQTAQVILAQIEHDQANPPHLDAVSRVKSLIEVANLKHAQAETVRIAAQRSLVELGDHAQLIDIELISGAGDVTGLNKLLDEHRELIARNAERIKELEAEVDLKAERLLQLEDQAKAFTQERDQALGDLDALKGVNQMHRVKLEKAEADLKAAQDALQKAPKVKK